MNLAGGAGLVDKRGLLKDKGETTKKSMRDSRIDSGYTDAVSSVGGRQAASEWIAIGRVRHRQRQASCRVGGRNTRIPCNYLDIPEGLCILIER